jgi:hypothetical protein
MGGLHVEHDIEALVGERQMLRVALLEAQAGNIAISTRAERDGDVREVDPDHRLRIEVPRGI